MKNRCFNLMAGSFSLLALFFFCSQNATAQNACPNPAFPGCQPPGSVDVFKVLLVLDESLSISFDPTAPALVRETANKFAKTLHDNATGTGQFEMGIVEFNHEARVGVTMRDVKSPGFLTAVGDYLKNNYVPSGRTNFTNALIEVRKIPDLDIVFFITDGDPDSGGGGISIANEIRCRGTYIFGIALGNNIQEDNIIAISGPDELGKPKNLAGGADWLRKDIQGLAESLVELANSLVDTKAPEVSCPADMTVNNDPGACGARVAFSTTATDICTANLVATSTPASGSEFPIGTTTVTSSATDDVGLTGSCSFKIIVKDDEPPTITCPGNIAVNNDPGTCSAKVTYASPARDNCTANPTTTSKPASGSEFQIGVTTVTSTSTDQAGNTASCSFTVTVKDQDAPIINCPADMTVDNDPGTCGAKVAYSTTATDNCTADLPIKSSHPSGSVFTFGVTKVASKTRDEAGNDARCTFTVNVIDKEAPAIKCPADVTVNNSPENCGAKVFFSTSSTDNCTANPIVRSNPSSGSEFPVGVTTVANSSTDDAGNTAKCSFKVIVTDKEAPAITCPADMSVRNDPGVCGAKVSFSTTATDNCTANPKITSTPASGSEFPVGTTKVSSTSTDEAGNASNCAFTVDVLDKEAPAITCPSAVTINIEESTAPARTGSPKITDNCSAGQPTHSDQKAAGSCNSEFTITRTWAVTDDKANESRCKQIIQVVDNTPPAITAPPQTVAGCDTSTAVTGVATVKDNGDPNPRLAYSDAVVSGNCDFQCTFERTWRATDECGNTSTKVQVIEKKITPRLLKALSMDIDGDGTADPLVLGITQTTFRVKADEADCILQWLPAKNGRPEALKGGNQGVEGNCKPGSNSVDADGRLANPLFGEGMKLALYLRLHPEFGELRMVDLDCDISRVILQGLGPSGNVRSFMDAANVALGNIRLTPHEKEWLEAFRCINRSLDLCD